MDYKQLKSYFESNQFDPSLEHEIATLLPQGPYTYGSEAKLKTSCKTEHSCEVYKNTKLSNLPDNLPERRQ